MTYKLLIAKVTNQIQTMNLGHDLVPVAQSVITQNDKGISYTKLDDPQYLKTTEIRKTTPTPPTTNDPDNAVPVHRRDKSSSSCPNTPIEKRRKHTKSLPELNKDDIDIAKRVATPERKSMSPTHMSKIIWLQSYAL